MNKNYFEIKRAGINTTFQDQGRGNLYHIGIPFSGAMDNRNFQISNKLVGNETNSPVIEFVTSIRPSSNVKESPLDGSDVIANSVPFTEATEVGVDIRNSLPFCLAIFAQAVSIFNTRRKNICII